MWNPIRSNKPKYDIWPKPTFDHFSRANKVIRDGRWSGIQPILELESRFRQLTNRKYALAHINGTAAIHAAYFSLGLKPGDEIIVPATTFWASALPALNFGLKPVICDINESTLGIDPENFRGKISNKTRAVVIVHFAGCPAQIDEILSVARSNGIRIIEDASHAHGAIYNGHSIGSFGDVSIFSLQSSKLCPAGEGGVLLTDSESIMEKALALGHYQRLNGKPGSATFNVAESGYGFQYRMSAINAALGIASIDQLLNDNKLRSERIKPFLATLKSIGFSIQDAPNSASSSVYMEVIAWSNFFNDEKVKQNYIRKLQEQGVSIITSPQRPLHLLPIFKSGEWLTVLERYNLNNSHNPYEKAYSLPVAEKVFKNSVVFANLKNPTKKLIHQISNIVVNPKNGLFVKSNQKSLKVNISTSQFTEPNLRTKNYNGSNFAVIGINGTAGSLHIAAILKNAGIIKSYLEIHDGGLHRLDSISPKIEAFFDEDKFFNYLKSNPVDFISICSPDDRHFEQIKKAISHGISVICEKPIVIHPNQLEELLELEKQSKIAIHPIMQARYLPELNQIKRNYPKKNSVKHKVSYRYHSPRGNWYLKSWRGDPKRSGGLLMDIGIHHLDLFIQIFGEPINFNVDKSDLYSSKGTLELETALIDWEVSIKPTAQMGRAINLKINQEDVKLSVDPTVLHPIAYEKIKCFEGPTLKSVRSIIKLTFELENQRRLQLGIPILKLS